LIRNVLAALLLFCAAAPVAARGLTPADLVSLDRASDAHASPDGQLFVWDQRATDLAGNRGTHALWIGSTSGAGEARLVNGGDGGTSPRWSADGRYIYFLKGGQVWRSAVGSGVSNQVTRLPLGVDGFRLAGDRIVLAIAVFPDAEQPAATKARQDAVAKAGTGRVYDKMFVRHWDTWADGTRNHLFSMPLGADGAAVGEPVALTPGLDGDVPSKPFGDDADFTLSPDGRTVYFSARIAGRSEPWSTNFDIFAVPVDGSAAPRNLTAANLAWDAMPAVSPDGKTLAYSAMARPGFEADKFTVRLMDLSTGQSRALTGGWDRSPDALKWSRDGRSLLAPAGDDGATPLFRIDAATGAATPLTKGGHVSEFEPLADGSILYVHDSMAHAGEVALLSAAGAARDLVKLNAQRLAAYQPSAAERFSFKGWNGDTVKGWILKPAGYEAGKTYPVAFLIHGGPQGSWNDSWSYRWNPQVFTGRGYAVVMVDPHGSTGYGQAFTDAVSNHWGDRPLEDLQKGWAAALKAAPFLDGSRACALGASYGGYMVNWIAGVWNTPWKCLVVHDGVFDDRLMGYATEELWFSEWEHGGIGKTPWADPAAYEKFNPINHVAKWTKPQLIIHSEKDYRIPVEQGLAAFDALQRRGIESRLLTLPDETQWVLKPANSLQWHDTVLGWLDAHLK
jgi:acylaminoacyl-peptidase